MRYLIITFIVLTVMASCSGPTEKQTDWHEPTLLTGHWRAVLQSPGGELPFSLEIARHTDTTFIVHAINGLERLALDQATVTGDSIRIPMELFESELVAKINDSTLTGRFTRYSPTGNVNMPFSAQYGLTYRFTDTKATPAADLTGKWAITFRSEQSSYPAVGVFEQKGDNLTGTFLTTTGDYRYLAGTVQKDSMFLSCFDGTHVYLFKAKVSDDGHTLTGGFWSSTNSYETWTARRDSTAALPDAHSLTFLKKGYDQLTFTFPDVDDGKPVSLHDDRYKGKVVVVQLMGSWCPNCMDETRFLAPWYQRNKARGVEIIALAYERVPEFSVSAPKLQKMKKRFDVDYEVLLAGIHDKEAAARTLPMIDKVLAFPSTIYIDKRGKVRRIHTGFSGPGTGKYYDEFVEDFNLFMDKLLAEEAM
jgi:thiol-disulfide isomerase/thioredoxin